MSNVTPAFTNAGQAVDSAIAGVLAQIQSAGPQPIFVPPANGTRDVIDVRDFTVKGDGKSDDAANIQRALDAVPFSKQPVPPGVYSPVVFFPALRYGLSTKLLARNPGTIIRGQGLFDGDIVQAKTAVSCLVPLPGFQGDAAISWDPLDINARWGMPGQSGMTEIRGMGAEFMTVDLTNSPMTTGFKARSLSNCPPWVGCTVYGGRSYGFDFAGSQIPGPPHSLPCEGFTMISCYVYGNMGANGQSQGGDPAAPMVRIAGMNEGKFVACKWLYFAQDTGNGPYPNNNEAAVLIESEVLIRTDQGSLVTPIGNLSFDGCSTANNRTHYRVRGCDYNGSHYRPGNISWVNCISEASNVSFEINQEPLTPGVDNTSWLSENICIDASNTYRWPSFGNNPMHVVADYILGGKAEFNNLVSGASFGPNTKAMQLFGGLNPNTAGLPMNLISQGRNRVSSC